MSLMGSIASIPRCPPHVRLAGNFGHAGWLAVDRVGPPVVLPYRSSDEALPGAMLRPARSGAEGARAKPAAASGRHVRGHDEPATTAPADMILAVENLSKA